MGRALREISRAERRDALLLNVGASSSVIIENALDRMGIGFRCDRIDVSDCAVEHPHAGEAWICSAEAMEPVESGRYDAVFANYVLEHVPNVAAAAGELHRVLKPGGVFVATVPNPTAPEYLISRFSPLWIHRLVRGVESWETRYDFATINALLARFESAGFRVESTSFASFTQQYLYRRPLLATLGRRYDNMVDALRIRAWMGNVFAAFVKEERFERH